MKKKQCNYCQDVMSAERKYYCASCEEVMFRECKLCHKPYQSKKYFKTHAEKCNSCCKKKKNHGQASKISVDVSTGYGSDTDICEGDSDTDEAKGEKKLSTTKNNKVGKGRSITQLVPVEYMEEEEEEEEEQGEWPSQGCGWSHAG